MDRTAMGWERFAGLVEECVGNSEFRELVLDLQNEPLLDRDLARRVTYVKERSSGRVFVGITTNGRVLTREASQRLIGAGIDRIVVSLNAARAQTFARIAPSPAFTAIVRNVQSLLELDGGSEVVKLSFGCSADNRDDLDSFVEHVECQGLDYRVFALHDRLGSVRNEAFLDLPVSETCHLPLFSMAVLANGDAILCCQDWERRCVLGNVFATSVASVWNSDRYVAIRRAVAEHGEPTASPCKSCRARYVYTAEDPNPRELARLELDERQRQSLEHDDLPRPGARYVLLRHGHGYAVYDFLRRMRISVTPTQAHVFRSLRAGASRGEVIASVYGSGVDASKAFGCDLDQMKTMGLLEADDDIEPCSVLDLPRQVVASRGDLTRAATLVSVGYGARSCQVELQAGGFVRTADQIELQIPCVLGTVVVPVTATVRVANDPIFECDVDEADGARLWGVLVHEVAASPLHKFLEGGGA